MKKKGGYFPKNIDLYNITNLDINRQYSPLQYNNINGIQSNFGLMQNGGIIKLKKKI